MHITKYHHVSLVKLPSELSHVLSTMLSVNKSFMIVLEKEERQNNTGFSICATQASSEVLELHLISKPNSVTSTSAGFNDNTFTNILTTDSVESSCPGILYPDMNRKNSLHNTWEPKMHTKKSFYWPKHINICDESLQCQLSCQYTRT